MNKQANKVMKWNGAIMNEKMEVLFTVANNDLGALIAEMNDRAKTIVESFKIDVQTLRVRDNESGQKMFRAYA